MSFVTAICLTILAVLAIAGGALLTLAGAVGAAIGREFAVEFSGGLRVFFGVLGAVGLVLFILGTACIARLLA